MRVLRGRAADRTADRERTAELVDWVADAREPGLRVWRPHRQLAFGRRDARAEDYQRAREIAIDHGYPPVERSTGGRAVAYTGTTAAFARCQPIEDIRVGLADRYEDAIRTVQRALWRLGVPAQRGEPPDAFCPGAHSLQWRGKIVGVAQRVRSGVALVGGVVIVRDHEAIADVLTPIYDALDVPFDPASVGSIERAGGQADPDTVVDTIEEAFVDDHDARVERVDRDV